MQRLRTMLVDDNAEIRTLMRAVIDASQLGIEVDCEASSGQEALDRLDSCDPDVIVLDQMMPGLTGMETARAILARRPGQRLVLCSAFVDEDLEQEALGAGFAAVIPKEEVTSLPETLLRAAGS